MYRVIKIAHIHHFDKKNKKFIEEKKLKQQLEKKLGKMEVDFVFLLKKIRINC